MKRIYLILFLSISTLLVHCKKEEIKLSSAKEILTFSFKKVDNQQLSSDFNGTITGSEIAFELPKGTDVNRLIANFTISEKAIIKMDNTLQISGQTKNNFNAPVIYEVIAEDKSIKKYTVKVNAPQFSNAKDLLTFAFLKDYNSNLIADCIGTISGTDININIPNGTDISQLIASFTISDKASIEIADIEQISNQTKNNFNSSIIYTIVAEDKTTKNYTVKINLIGISPNFEINKTTSYYYYQSNNLYINFATDIPQNYVPLAKACADFDKDGDLDVMEMTFNYTQNIGLEVEYFQNNNGVFVKNQTIFNSPIPTYVHGRKAIIGDFDKNGWLDVIIAGHGWDQQPFPGEEAKILLNFNGKFTTKTLPLAAGFYHSVCAGDIDNDNDMDLFFTHNFSVGKFLINDGTGNFTYDASLFPATLAYKGYYTSELYDINNDGYLDLVNTGHEHEGANSIILWGNFTGKYTTDRMTILPTVSGQGVVIDIDFIDYNDDNKTDIVLNRTSSNPFYQGYYLQMVKNEGSSFTDVTPKVIMSNSNPTAQWIDWLRIHDVNGDGKLDITTENKSYNLQWININGVFSK